MCGRRAYGERLVVVKPSFVLRSAWTENWGGTTVPACVGQSGLGKLLENFGFPRLLRSGVSHRSVTEICKALTSSVLQTKTRDSEVAWNRGGRERFSAQRHPALHLRLGSHLRPGRSPPNTILLVLRAARASIINLPAS